MAIKHTPYFLLAFLAGVGVRSFFNIPQNWILGALGLVGGILLILYFFKFNGKFLVFNFIFLVFLLGMFRFSIFENKITADQLHNYYGQTATLKGMVLSSALKQNSYRIVLETDLGRILIVKRIYPEYKYGDVLKISGKIAEPEPYAGFDTAKFLAKQQIYSQMIFPEIKKIGYSPNKFLNSLFFIKNKFEESLKSIMPEPEASLASGMLLGVEGVIQQDILDNFRKAGVIHILVLSGYNITVVGAFIMAFLGFILPDLLAWIGSLFGILAFTLMTGGEPAAVRAAIMAVIGLVALRTGRSYLAILGLLWAAFFMAFWNPMYVRFDRGFQLSFLATFGLILFSSWFIKKLGFLPKFLGIREAAASTLSAQIFVTPLLLSWGNLVSYLSPLANVVVVGFVPTIMFFSFAAGILGFFSNFLGTTLALVPYFLIKFQILAAQFFASADWAVIYFNF